MVVFARSPPVLPWWLRPHTPSPLGSLALARSAGGVAAVASTGMSSSRPPRPPRRGDGRSASAARSGRPAEQGAAGTTRRPPRQMTAAERRAAEVNAKRAPRPPRDPDAERQKIEDALGRAVDRRGRPAVGGRRTLPTGRRRRRSARSASARWRPTPRQRSPLAPATPVERPPSRPGWRRRRMRSTASASTMLGGSPRQLLRELPDVAAVHEVLGLAAYRSGRWKQAATALEAAQQLHPTVELLPVLADVYRAQRRWADVERIWEDVRGGVPGAGSPRRGTHRRRRRSGRSGRPGRGAAHDASRRTGACTRA